MGVRMRVATRLLGLGGGRVTRFSSVACPRSEVLVVVGPSGSGKTTLIQRLMRERPGCFGFSVSHTTRQPRSGEVSGVDYNFCAPADMESAIAGGAFIEHAEVHGNYYGTSVDGVKSVVGAGKVCVLDIDVQGAEQVKASALSQSASYLFIRPPSNEALESRLRGRGTETEDKIQLRLAGAQREMKFADDNVGFFDATVLNDSVDDAFVSFRTHVDQFCGVEGSASTLSSAAPL